ncbi:MAG TPA: DUF4124 domain-containing protein [Steroidobacteraceae bacterium]|nr:DUF4124 domain-containing protein [Steroidobacteraceae bacterium]
MWYPRSKPSAWRRVRAGALLLALAVPLAAQEIYKSVDAQGNVVYSDRGANKNAPTTTLHVTEPDPSEVTRLAKQQQLMSAAERERQKEAALEERNRARSQQQHQAACEKARNNYYRMKDTPHLFQRDADGNRVYYTDEQADALREQARKAMLSACGS